MDSSVEEKQYCKLTNERALFLVKNHQINKKKTKMFRKYSIGLLFVSLLILCTEAIGQYDVEFEPSTPDIVALMLTMANVTGDDIVYDLGCGDGRIVINAAKKYSAYGIGVDIDPVRIAESKENAVKEGVTDRVQFIEQDLFKADISKATVVTLYLLPSVNLKLRPKLFRELKPGTRIVSHEHYMGEWEPDQTSEIYTGRRNHKVYFWVLPANVYGTWEWIMSDGNDKRRYVLNMDQKFQQVSGNLTVGGSNIPLKNISIKGDRLQFTAEKDDEGKKVTLLFDGLVDGNSIEGTVESNTNPSSGKSNWKAKRDPSTIIPLDNSNN